MISASQRDVLEQIFAKTAYPKRSTIQKLAEKLELGKGGVYNWFTRERFRVRQGKYQESHDDLGEFAGIYSVQV